MVVASPSAQKRAEAIIRRAAYGRTWHADAIRAIREMRYRMEEGAASSNLKRGPGGVVDIEFVVQVMQLVHGGANPALQTPETLAGLVALHAAGHLGDDAFEFFETAYRVLR